MPFDQFGVLALAANLLPSAQALAKASREARPLPLHCCLTWPAVTGLRFVQLESFLAKRGQLLYFAQSRITTDRQSDLQTAFCPRRNPQALRPQRGPV